MKLFFFVLLLLCCGLLSFAAEQSDQYCYGACDCRHPKSYGVCERYVPIHE